MEIKKIKLQSNSSLTVIHTEKFKTTSVYVFFKGTLERETATGYSLLYRILPTATKNHPSIREMATHKDYLYGTTASLSSVVRGSIQNTMLAVTAIDDHYVSEKGLLEKQFQLVHEILYEPFGDGHQFDPNFFTERQRSLKRMLLSIEDDKESFAQGRLMDLLGDEPAGVRTYGYVQEVDNWTNERVYQLYETLLKQPMDIYVVGRVNETEVKKLVAQYLKGGSAEVLGLPLKPVKPAIQLSPVKETKKFNQSQLGQIYTLESNYLDSSNYSAIMFNALFGGTPLSKLFKVVREEHGLCYSINSSYNFSSGIISVMSGISAEKFDQAHQLIEQLLLDLREGRFTDEDLQLNQRLMVTSVRRQFDSPDGIVQYLFMHDLVKSVRSLEEFTDGLQKVTKNDIQKMAATVKLKVDYFLEGKVE